MWTYVDYENGCEVADELIIPEHFHDVLNLFNVCMKQVESNDIQVTEINLAFSKLINEFCQ